MKKKHYGYAGTMVSTNYVDCLKKLYPQVKEGNSIDNPMVVPFVLTCAAAIEAKLNDALISWAWNSLGKDEYKNVAEALVTMSLRGKLDAVVVLLSQQRFVFIRESNCYQSLVRLISVRNKLLHNKGYFEEIELEFDEISNQITILNEEFFKRLMKTPFLDMDANDCMNFYRALEDLDEKVFYLIEKNSLTENDVVRLNPGA